MTKTLATAAAAAALFFAASAQAGSSSYAAFTAGNPDIGGQNPAWRNPPMQAPRAASPTVDRYQGIADGNRDLLGMELGMSPPTMIPDIYGPFGGSRDLLF